MAFINKDKIISEEDKYNVSKMTDTKNGFDVTSYNPQTKDTQNETVNNDSRYYTRDEVNSKTDIIQTAIDIINGKIDALVNFKVKVLEELPETGEDNVLYFIPKNKQSPDTHDEYVWVDNAFEFIGTTDIDLTPYATIEWVNTELNKKANTNHVHVKNDITDFAHTHVKNDITDFAHNHDNRYYTEEEIDNKISQIQNLIPNLDDVEIDWQNDDICFVSDTAEPDGDGSIYKPFQTIQQGYDSGKGTIFVLAGIYDHSNSKYILMTRPCNIIGVGDVYITSDEYCFQLNPDYYTFNGKWLFKNLKLSAREPFYQGMNFNNGSLEINNCTLTFTTGSNFYFEGNDESTPFIIDIIDTEILNIRYMWCQNLTINLDNCYIVGNGQHVRLFDAFRGAINLYHCTVIEDNPYQDSQNVYIYDYINRENQDKLDNISPNANKVEITRDISSGTKIGTIKIDNVPTDLYIPTPIEPVTYDVATETTDGLLSNEDKIKLDNIEAQANKITVDTALSSTSTNPVQNKKIQEALNNKAGTSVASNNANGLMSKEDKIKLDGIDVEANRIVIDNSISTSSTNPVENRAVHFALSNLQNMIDGKSDIGHTHTKNELTGLDETSMINLMDNGVFVSSNGSDTTGNGTFSNPYKTIQKAVTNVPENGIVYVFGGNYTENGIDLSVNCTIMGLGEVNIIINRYPVSVGEDCISKIINLNFIGTTDLMAGFWSLISLWGNSELIIYDCKFENIDYCIISTFDDHTDMYNNGNIVKIYNSVFQENTAYIVQSKPSLIRWVETLEVNNCKFTQNNLPNGTLNACIFCSYLGGNTKITNCIFENNSSVIINDSQVDYRHSHQLVIMENIIETQNNVYLLNSSSIIRKGNVINGIADYEAVATSSANGLMSNTDKVKIDNMQTIPLVVTFDDDTTATYNLYKSG